MALLNFLNLPYKIKRRMDQIIMNFESITEMSIPFNKQIPIPKTLSADSRKHIIRLSGHANLQAKWFELIWPYHSGT
uniref:Uncharacterized protein n=1 Tax=Glycine max TaxID=3847 RepID=K7L504_SOYBN